MQYALLIYETSADFGRREQAGDDATYFGAWRAYYKAVGDFFRSAPKGADAYLLGSVIHNWDDDAAARILEKRCGRRCPTTAGCCWWTQRSPTTTGRTSARNWTCA
jgi:hypothetical protein